MKSKPNFTKTEIAALQTAYKQAIYEVYYDSETIQLKIGEYCPELDELITQGDHLNWALITAFNPYSQSLSKSVNQQRHQKLLNYLLDLQLSILPALGKDSSDVWTPEQSLVIFGISRCLAISIGRKFEQNAIVYGELYQLVGLLWL